MNQELLQTQQVYNEQMETLSSLNIEASQEVKNITELKSYLFFHIQICVIDRKLA